MRYHSHIFLFTILFAASLSAKVSESNSSPEDPSHILESFNLSLALLGLYAIIITMILIIKRGKQKQALSEKAQEIENLRKHITKIEEKISQTHKLIGAGYWEYNKRRHNLWISPELSLLLSLETNEGYVPIETLEKTVTRSRRDELLLKVKSTIDSKTEGNEILRLTPKTGKTLYIRLFWENQYDEQDNYILSRGIILDITPQQLHELKMRKVETQLRSIVDGINTPIYLKDIEGRFQLTNRAFRELYPLNKEKSIGKSAYDLFPKGLAQNNSQREKIVLTKGESVQFEESFGEGNNKRIFSTTKFPLFDTHSTIIGLVAMSVDISAQKQMERDLIKARDKAEFAFRSKSEFLANMSHEIRTPLNAVTGFSELLQDIVEDEQQKRYLTAIKTAGKTLLTLINDILDLSKLEAGKVTLNLKATSLRTIFNELEHLFMIKAHEKGLQLTFFISNTVPTYIDIDPERVTQILMNLVGNALKFTEHGTITVSAEISVNKEHLILMIKDTGVGIAAASIETIFDDFQQQSGQDSRKYGGTGLGLSICKRLVTLMNGEIYVSSKPGAGTIFTITLPLITCSEQTALTTDNKSIPTLQFSGESIWIAEDSDSNRILLEEALSQVNIKPRGFTSAVELLKALESDTPHIILTDFQMPEMNGFDLLQTCKTKEHAKNIPIILLTTLDNIQEYNYFTGKGFDYCLQKPIEIEQLYKLLTKYCTTTDTKEQVPQPLPSESHPIPTELITYLEKNFLTRVKALKGAIKLEEIKRITQELESQDRVREIPQLSDFIDRIYSAIQQFDVIRIKALPQKTEEFIEQCREEIQ